MKCNKNKTCLSATICIKNVCVSDIDLNQRNYYFANIASDPSYSSEKVIALQAPDRPANCNNYPSNRFQNMLPRISSTSPGNDNMPYWDYRDSSSELAEVVTRIYLFYFLFIYVFPQTVVLLKSDIRQNIKIRL